MPSDCLVSIVLGMERDKTMTKPLLVPTHRVGQVDTVFSMKVQEKWRLRTRLPSSAITLRSGRQESGTSFSGINGVVSEENCSLFFSCTLAVWLLLNNGKYTSEQCHILNVSYTTLTVQIALCKSVISLRKITYHTAKIFHDFPCFYFMSFSWFYAHIG